MQIWSLRNACKYGHLEIVKYLLTSPELKNHSDLHWDNDTPFILACYAGNVELVKYLLTSPELKSHSNIHASYMNSSDYGLILACQNGNIDVVKYLLTSPDLKEHANIHADGDRPLLNAWQRKRLNIVEFFIFDLNIEKIPTINVYLHHEQMDDVIKMFEARELKNQLNKELSQNLMPNSIQTKKL